MMFADDNRPLGEGTHPVLALNADYRPLSYYPLSLWSWQDAVKAVFCDRVDPVAYYDTRVRAPGMSMRVPSVVAHREFVRLDRSPRFTRFNVFLRDRFRCAYCGERPASSELTFDHVKPRSLGGGTNWLNILTACSKCNTLKGSRPLGAKGVPAPLWTPFAPTLGDLNEAGREFPPPSLHETWLDFLYWDCELDTD